MAAAEEVTVSAGWNEIRQKGCHRSFRSAGGTVFLPLKGSWRREKLFFHNELAPVLLVSQDNSTYSH